MEKPTVATPSKAVLAMRAAWDLSDALLGGTDAMRSAGQAYLPKWPAEDEKSYEERLKTAVLFPAYQRTVATLTGKPFSKPVTIGEDVPEELKGYCENIDLEGRNLHTFASDVLERALGLGMSFVLVDFPVRPDGVRTQADEQKAGLRPYAVHIHPRQVLGWKQRKHGGQWSLAQFRFMEAIEEDDGAYAAREVEQVRVLEPGKWQTHRKNDKGEWVLHEEGTTTLKYIPLAVAYGQRTGFMSARPPLLEVAHLNVAHWQSASDQQTVLHVARVPILAAIGVEDTFSLVVGAQTAVCLPTNADLKFVEHTGAAIEAGAKDLKDLEERMRQAGAELLVLQPGKVTATQVQTENAVGMCALQRITLALQDALNLALDYTAMWLKEPTAGTLTLFNDFGVASLAEASAQLLQERNLAGKLSDETTHREFQRRGIISADVDWDKERQRIEDRGPALGTLNERQPAAA